LSALFILIGISILVAASFLIAFLWSVKSGQYDDDYTPSVRMLFDDPQKNNIQPDKENILANNQTNATPVIIKK
jgi:cbb3-type cytochrome oxidase maturation protein